MYEEHYGFSGKPFQLTPDPRFLYESSGHRRALAYLRYGVQEGQGFIVLTGGVGAGKTMLAESLYEELDFGAVVAAKIVSTNLEADDLLRSVVAAFGLDHREKNKASLLQMAEQFLRSCVQSGKRALLLVDEAQNLSVRALEELRMLSNFEANGSPLLQSFLLGQQEFRKILAAPEMEQMRQRVIASCHLDPLSEVETRDYIEHRLRVVGWKQNPAIDNEAFTRIHHFTGGIPRRINLLCDRLLLHCSLEEFDEIAGEVVEKIAKEFEGDSKTLREAPLSTVATATGNKVSNPPLEKSPSYLEGSTDAFVREPPAPAAAPLAAENTELRNRLADLERLVARLTVDRQTEINGIEIDRLTRQVAELKPVVESLQRSIWELTKLISSRLGKNHSARQSPK